MRSAKKKAAAPRIVMNVRRKAEPTSGSRPSPGAEAMLARPLPAITLKHPLAEVFDEALAQATRGKGNARHGQGRDSTDPDNFFAQDWNAIAKRHGPAFLSGQAEKKLREALDLQHAERRGELLGVIVYVAMLVIHHDRVGR